MADTYVGAPWRSRYLRAPKVGLVLAQRPDFTRLGDLATVQLGLKSGADSFFFLRRMEARPTAEARVFGFLVEGLGRQWTGHIASPDLRPAVLNPHQLFADNRRILRIPRQTTHFYLQPRRGALRAELAAYVEAGERAEINRRPLVRQNASTDAWYRQVRGVLSSPWALPYSSGYDYGAWQNASRAVLNGRFLGVEALEQVETQLLGAILNSTFSIVGRLLVGTTTGVEGAFDVGPPAARELRLPDPRQMSDAGAVEVLGIFGEWIAGDEMLPAPSRTSHVDVLRHRLDMAILEALGCGRGEASSIVGSLYESYARWRGSVENVETMMRANRREMARNRTGRTVSPIELAAQRVWEELMPDFPPLPSSLLLDEDTVEDVNVDKTLNFYSQQPQLLPGGVVLQGGNQADLGSFDRVRYAAMLISIGFEPPVAVLQDAGKAAAVVQAFELSHQSLLEEAQRRAGAYVRDDEAKRAVVGFVERRWLATCREHGMAAPLKLLTT